MGNRHLYVSVLALALAACGGSGGGDGGGTTVVPGGTASPTPTPTPTATPAPTPSPTPTATPVAPPAPTSTATFQQLSGAVVLQSANTGFSNKTNPPIELGVNEFGKGVRYIYDLQARSMKVESGAVSTQFVAAEIDANAPAGTTRYAKADGSRLSLITPGEGAGLRWTRFIDATLAGPDSSRLLSLTGMPTPEADIPTTGSASFTRSAVIGEAYVQTADGMTSYALDGSTATMSVDYATRRITFSLTLTGRPSGGGASVTLLTASGSSNMDGSSPADMKASSPIISRYLSFLAAGGLFGPQGAEVGTTFSFRGTSDDGRTVLNFAGLAAGGR